MIEAIDGDVQEDVARVLVKRMPSAAILSILGEVLCL